MKIKNHIAYRNDGSCLCGFKDKDSWHISDYQHLPSRDRCQWFICGNCKRSAKTILAGKGRGWLAKNIQKGLGIPEKARRI